MAIFTFKNAIFLFLTLFTASPVLLFGQQQRAAISLKPSYGLDLATSSVAGERNFQYGVQATYHRSLTTSAQPWTQLLNAKGFSVGLLWTNMQQMHELVEEAVYDHGHAFGAIAEVDFQLVQLGAAKLSFVPGLGLSYLTKTINTQPATVTVGSHLNMALSAGLQLEVPLGNDLSLLGGGNILHYSNGGMRVPNGGINTFNVSLGLKQGFDTNLPGHHTRPSRAFKHIEGSSGELAIGMGRRGKYRAPSEGFYRTGVYAGYNYFFNQAFGLKAGFDMVYYHTVFDIDRFDETFQYYGSSYDHIRMGAGVGVDVAMSRLVVSGLVGKYLHYNSYHEDVDWYWTSGLRYYFTPHIGLQSTLYMHRVQADFINWGVVLKI